MILITDDRFTELMTIKKYLDDISFVPPSMGNNNSYSLHDATKKELFNLDIDRGGKIELGSKIKTQNRYYNEVLIRLEIDCPPHINPDGERLSRNHIHVYREGYGDSWAYELSTFDGKDFNKCHSFDEYLIAFCDFCNIVIPDFQTSM